MEKAPQPEAATPEKILPTTPHLRYIEKTLALLGTETGEDGQETNWKNLSEKVGEWNSGLELANNVRAVVRDYLLLKFPAVQEKIPSIAELPEREMLDAISNGWFEGLAEEVGGTRKEILLSVLAHMARKIETRVFKQTLQKANAEDLQKLGLTPDLRNLTTDCLDASVKSDPLFIRFLAYTQLSPKPPEDAKKTTPIGPDGAPHTFAELFPHETQFIEAKLVAIAQNDGGWKNEPGAEEFKSYVALLSQFYGEKDPAKTEELHGQVVEKYNSLVLSEFPITIVPPIEGYYKPPYLDPELRVVVRTSESKAQEGGFRELQTALADKMEGLGVGQFSDEMKKRAIRSYISLGSYGVNLTFVAAAQQSPAIALYLDEQIRAYDKSLKKFLTLIDVPEHTFDDISPEQIEEMSRNDTVLHELSHYVYPIKTPEADRLGPDNEMVLAETTAESMHRGVAKELIADKKLPYTEDQYIAMSIGMALQSLKDNEPDDEYYKADVYALNGMFEKGIAEFDGTKIRIKDNAAFFGEYKNNATELIALYQDETMTPAKAEKWIKEKCTACPKFQEFLDYLKEKELPG